MSQMRVYLKTYDANGDLEADFTEITKYVDLNSIASLTQSLDNTEYDIGIVRNSTLNLKCENNGGLFSTPDIPESFFRFKRSDSIIRVTWDSDDPLLCGFCNAGEVDLAEELTLFEGLLNDDATSDATKGQLVSFQVFGYESLLSRVNVPFSAISNGDLISEVLYALFNQSPITDFVTVSQVNIVPSTDVTIDAIASLENKKVSDILSDLLLLANSVLYIDVDNVLYVSNREPDATVDFEFYGQGSNLGSENIVDMTEIKTGVNRVINSVAWKDAGIIVQDAGSINTYETRQKEISSDLLTDSSKRTTVLRGILSEFLAPKKEMKLKAVMKLSLSDIANVGLLSRVTIDYPLVPLESTSETVARYGTAIYGTDRYAAGLFNLFIDPADEWKVMERQINIREETVILKLRAV